MTKQKQVAEVEEVDSAFLGELGSDQRAWLTTVNLNGHKTLFKLDTGAEVTAISEDTYQMLKRLKMSTSHKKLYGQSQQSLNCIGQFSGKLSYKSKTVTQNVFVVCGLKNNLLGLPAITTLELAARLDETGTRSSEDYRKDSFEDWGIDLQPLNESVLREIHPLPKWPNSLEPGFLASLMLIVGFGKFHWPRNPSN